MRFDFGNDIHSKNNLLSKNSVCFHRVIGKDQTLATLDLKRQIIEFKVKASLIHSPVNLEITV